MLIVFEGEEGVGKSTQAKRFADRLTSEGRKVRLLREPGGTEIGEEIRTILKSVRATNMASITELMLFSAARAQLVREVIQPALARGEIVILDRFFYSTLAYQGYGRGLRDEAERLIHLSVGSLQCDLVFLMMLPIAVMKKRMAIRAESLDRIERAGDTFFEKVRKGFSEMVPWKEVVLIANLGTEDEVGEHIYQVYKKRCQ
jgi:dTMP kinase